MSSLKFSEDQRNSFNEFGTSNAMKNELDSFNEFDSSDALNNGLTMEEIFKYQPEAGTCTLRLGTLDYHAISQLVNTPTHQNHLAQREACPFQFETVTHYAMSPGLMNVHPPHQLDEPEGPFNMANPYMSPQMNLSQLAKPGNFQSSNSSNATAVKRLKKRESDRRSREKKEKTRKENEEKLAEVTVAYKHLRKQYDNLRKENASLQEGQAMMKIDLENFKEKASYFEKQADTIIQVFCLYKDSNLKSIALVTRAPSVQANSYRIVEDLYEKLVASAEATDLVGQNKQLKRRIDLLMTGLKNPNSMKIVELHEEKEKWKRKAERLQVINEALCDKMNNDEQ